LDVKKARAPRKAHTEQPAPIAKPAHPPIDWRSHGLIAMALWVVLLAGYSNSFRSGLVFDNAPIILDDARIHAATPQNIDAIWSKGYWFKNQDPTLYRPLTTFSYLFNYAILGNGPRPAGYHWVNFLLHGINALLVYSLGLVLFRKMAPAAALAALWAVHPVLTESVTNIVGRADLLSGLGVLAGLLCHMKAGSAVGVRKIAWLAGLAAAAAIAVSSKESGVVLIALMLVYDIAFRGSAIRACVPGYAVALAPFAVYFHLRSEVLATLPAGAPQFVNNPLVGVGFWSARLTAVQVIGRYLWLLVWPQHLSCDYSYNQIPVFRGAFNNWADWATVLALAVCIAAAGAAVVCFRRNKAVFFFIGLFFIALSPGANIALLLVTVMAERFLYLPAVGFVGCLVWALHALAERAEGRWPRATIHVAWVAGLLCLALLVRTHVRNFDWENEQTLWSRAVKAAPASYKTHLNLATVAFPKGAAGMDEAIAEDQRALAILSGLAPGQEDPLTFANIGGHFRAKGDAVRKTRMAGAEEQSRDWYRKSLEILQRGVAVDRARSEATDRANRAAGKNPGIAGWYQVYQELGQTYLRLDQPQKALEALDYGMYIQPTHEFFQLISDAHRALNDQDGAAIALMEGVMMFPDQKAFPSELLKLYDSRNPPGCAVERTAAGASLNLGCPMVHNHLCAAAGRLREWFTRKGQFSEAEKMRIQTDQSLGCPAP
jgi:tetratricopeptide (TPR) repeat protein